MTRIIREKTSPEIVKVGEKETKIIKDSTAKKGPPFAKGFTTITVSSTPPENPAPGDIWINTT